METYVSYIFGGIIQEPDGRLSPTNDLIQVTSKRVLPDASWYVAHPIRPSESKTGEDIIAINLIEDQAGVRPLPRRDHTAILIKNNELMLVYAGKNDNAFQYTTNH